MEIQSTKQKSILKTGYVFLGIVLVCSFFSKTLSKMMLTHVSVALPKSGAVVKTFTGEGSAEFRDTYKLFAPADTKVLKVYVRKGDKVKAGQKLCLLDLTELKNAVNQVEIKKAVSETALKALEGKKQSLLIEKQDLEEAIKSNWKNAEFFEIEQKINQSDSRIKKAETVLKVDEELFSKQLISQDELNEAAQSLTDVKNEKEKFLLEKQNKLSDSKRQLRSYENDITNLETQIETEKLNQQSLALEYAQKLKALKEAGTIEVKEDGIITDLRFEEGASVTQGQELLSIGCYRSGYQVCIPFDKEVDFIEPEDKVTVSIPSVQLFDIKGKVAAITIKENKHEAEIVFTAKGLQGGEAVKIKLEKNLGEFDIVIPYSAIIKDNFKSFVFTVKKADNPLGQAYTIQKKPVYIEACNEEYAAISEGIDFLDWVVIASDKEIQNGEKVNVENENDVLEENKR